MLTCLNLQASKQKDSSFPASFLHQISFYHKAFKSLSFVEDLKCLVLATEDPNVTWNLKYDIKLFASNSYFSKSIASFLTYSLDMNRNIIFEA